jgi:hypothetical protein
MAYTVEVRLDGERVSMHVAAIWKWIEVRKIEPPVFRYRMTDEDVMLRLEFGRSTDAAEFREHFGMCLARRYA